MGSRRSEGIQTEVRVPAAATLVTSRMSIDDVIGRRMKIQLDNAWRTVRRCRRQRDEGRHGSPRSQQAMHESKKEGEAQTKAMEDMEAKAVAKATGPTTAPIAEDKKKHSSESSSGDEDEDSSSRPQPPTGRLSARVQAAAPRSSSLPQPSLRAHKLHGEVRTGYRRHEVRRRGPLDADPPGGVELAHDLVVLDESAGAKGRREARRYHPDLFRVYYKEGVFSFRAPWRPRSPRQRDGHRRGRKPQHRSPAQARRGGRPAMPPQHPDAPRHRAPQRSRLVFRSGVLEGTCPAEQPRLFTLWPQTPQRAQPEVPPTRNEQEQTFVHPCPKKQARQPSAPSGSQPHPEHIADLLRSIANIIARRPSSATTHTGRIHIMSAPMSIMDHA